MAEIRLSEAQKAKIAYRARLDFWEKYPGVRADIYVHTVANPDGSPRVVVERSKAPPEVSS